LIDLSGQIWALLSPLHSQILSLLFTIIGAVVFWVFRSKVKLIWGRSNNSIHFVQANDARTEIYCEKYFIQNTGRKPAEAVQFVMSFKPDDFSIFPSRGYEQTTNPEGKFVTEIPFVAPHELVIIDVVYIQRKAALVEAVVCSDAIGKPVNFVTNRQFGSVVNVGAFLLMILGIAFIIQTALSLVLEITP
jgi:hypothetical protein